MTKVHIPIQSAEQVSDVPTRAQVVASVPPRKTRVRRWPAAIFGIAIPLLFGTWYLYSPQGALFGFLQFGSTEHTIIITTTGVAPDVLTVSSGDAIKIVNTLEQAANIDLGPTCTKNCILRIAPLGTTTLPKQAPLYYTVNVQTELYSGIILPDSN